MALKLIPHLQKAGHLLILHLERFRMTFGITPPEAQILAALTTNQVRAIADLQKRLGFKPSTLTSILDRLVARGFIVRTPRDDDRRSVNVKLTQTGRRPALIVRRSLEQLETKIVSHTTRVNLKDLQGVTKILEKLTPSR
jgi:DNA-binding MarR family transcriptional regulator|tara:strand:+ start:2438 stop:2857 length:420 start_codon:yes stop_codon:yes gene_type:complete